MDAEDAAKQERVVAALVTIAKIYEEVVREEGPVPSGYLFAAMMPLGLPLAAHQMVLDTMVACGRFVVKDHVVSLGPKAVTP